MSAAAPEEQLAAVIRAYLEGCAYKIDRRGSALYVVAPDGESFTVQVTRVG